MMRLEKKRARLLVMITVLLTCTIYIKSAIHISSRGHFQLQQSDIEVISLNKKFSIDKDGNKVQVFSNETIFLKPGGGLCQTTSIQDPEEYFNAITIVTVQCKLEEFGGYKVCVDGFNKQNRCVALSFGISWEFSFEDSIIDKLGCQAHSFDPTMSTPDYDRKNGKDKFYDLGLSSFKGSKTMRYMQRTVMAKLDRYVNIVKRLGLTNTEIDFLKVDIEGSEYDFFLDTASNNPELFNNVKQIQLELHNLEKDPRFHSGNNVDTTQLDMMKIVDILKCHGYALAYSKPNRLEKRHQFMYKGKQRSLCYVTTWIRP